MVLAASMLLIAVDVLACLVPARRALNRPDVCASLRVGQLPVGATPSDQLRTKAHLRDLPGWNCALTMMRWLSLLFPRRSWNERITRRAKSRQADTGHENA
jgi:hypothetical protein